MTSRNWHQKQRNSLHFHTGHFQSFNSNTKYCLSLSKFQGLTIKALFNKIDFFTDIFIGIEVSCDVTKCATTATQEKGIQWENVHFLTVFGNQYQMAFHQQK